MCWPSIAGSVWKLSRDPHGCREVQEALEASTDEDVKLALAAELKGHVWEAIRCPHANYVVQKLIACIRPQGCQFVIDELMRRGPGAAAQAARHRFGCRILERLLERCSPQQVRPLVEDLITDAAGLSSHPYGNYVVQHVLEHSSPDQQRRLCGLLGRHAVALGSDSYASAVIAKALAQGNRDTRLMLARHTMASPGLLSNMARTRHGHVAVKLVLQLLEDLPEERAAACRDLEADVCGLRQSRYGRFVAACLGSPPARARSVAAEALQAKHAAGGA